MARTVADIKADIERGRLQMEMATRELMCLQANCQHDKVPVKMILVGSPHESGVGKCQYTVELCPDCDRTLSMERTW